MSILLTPLESELCSILDAYTSYHHTLHPSHPRIIARIAGGWVRDKLLHLQSSDIDVALSSVTGLQFALGLSEYCKEVGVQCGKYTKIEANPEKSKHLETTRFDVLGVEMDFVNLRAEDYAADSRVPVQRFGTPLEDALRRDLTINALFFNVHTRQVEDYTKKGLDDLRNGICRTPLPPRQTFLDDPLRVPRAIRFAARFNFVLDEELKEAARLEEVKEALILKVSRERVGGEVEKMLKGPNPLIAIKHIHSLTLHPTIFYLPPTLSSTLSSPPLPLSTGLTASSILDHLLTQPEFAEFRVLGRARLENAVSVRKRLFLGAELTPWRGGVVGEGKGRGAAVGAIVREGLKLSNDDITSATRLFAASQLLSNPVLSRFPEPQRVSIGLLLRQHEIHDPLKRITHWEDSIAFSLVQDLIPFWDDESSSLKEGAEEVIRTYRTFVERVVELGLPAAIEEKPRLDGKEVAATLKIKPGPAVKTILDSIIAWQLEHPKGTKEECKAWLLEQVESGALKVDVPGSAGKAERVKEKETEGGEGEGASKRPRKQ